jgi:hypothetical protein
VAEFLRNAAAQTFVEHSAEARMQLNSCSGGGAKSVTAGRLDPNMRPPVPRRTAIWGMIFMDRIDIITAHATRVASQ